nr:hypothetical protein BaRGS_028722 [Batillaria attramentaria]
MVETSESARIKLFKNIENCSRENLARPLMFMNPFLQPGEEKDFTVLDTCLGRTDCLNLKHVTQLESKLSTLYKELIKVSQSLEVKSWANHDPLSSHVAGAVRERVQTVVLRAGAMARDCAADLLSLSLLYPSAPWPPLKKPTMTEVTYEALAPALPSLPRSKAGEVQRCVTSALKACNHRCHMLGQEVSALREEVRFHQDVYDIQLHYVQQVFAALSNGYADFEKSTGEVIVQPMKKLMSAYDSLRATSSEKSLREFLLVIKENTEQKEREQAAANKSELKVVQQQLEDELRALIRDAEEQQKIAEEVKASSSGQSGINWRK